MGLNSFIDSALVCCLEERSEFGCVGENLIRFPKYVYGGGMEMIEIPSAETSTKSEIVLVDI